MIKKITYISIFPEYFINYFSLSIPKRALKNNFLSFETYNLRDFARKKKVDDYPYGGGVGMLLKIEPFFKIIEKIKKENNNTYFILLSAQGKIFSQKDVDRYLTKDNLIFVCGHYEGIDSRIKNYIDEEVSLGKFISLGGEIPSLLITECLIRAIPGVIKKESYCSESYNENNEFIFDFDSYTRPDTFNELKVPDVLLSGNHAKIEEWRRENMRKKHKKVL